MTKVEIAFKKLLKAYNKKEGGWKRLKNGKLQSISGWILDNGYGGYKVAEKRGTSSVERDLFDMKRRKPAEFVRWVDVVVGALNMKKRGY